MKAIKEHLCGCITKKEKDNPLYIIPVIIFGILSYLNLYLLDWELIKVLFSSEEIIKQYTFNISQLINIYPIIGEYILISLMIICFLKIFEKKLKSYDKDGLIKEVKA